MQISTRRPLWRVITPYRYKGRVSCHSGDELVVVLSLLFLFLCFPVHLFLLLSLSSRHAVYRFYERLHKGQDVHGSLNLLSEDPIPSDSSSVPSVISLLFRHTIRWIPPEIIRGFFLWKHIERNEFHFTLCRSFSVYSFVLRHFWLASFWKIAFSMLLSLDMSYDVLQEWQNDITRIIALKIFFMTFLLVAVKSVWIIRRFFSRFSGLPWIISTHVFSNNVLWHLTIYNI